VKFNLLGDYVSEYSFLFSPLLTQLHVRFIIFLTCRKYLNDSITSLSSEV